MKTVVAWIKSNPVSVGALIIGCFCLVWLLLINADGNAFKSRMSLRDREINRIKALQQTLVKVPPTHPDDPEQKLKVPVNQAAINQLERVFNRMNQEYREVFQLAVELNKAGHKPMLEGLFPQPVDASKPFEARIQYRSLIEHMVGGGVSAFAGARLKVASPPPMSQVQEMLKDVEIHFLASLLSPKSSVDQLSASESTELDTWKQKKVYEFFERTARLINLYAQTQIDMPDFPLDVGDWSNPGLRPRMTQIWEGQLGLWIQQDILEVIARTNRVDDRKSNVINAPVKRLIRVAVVPGYVGLETGGGDLAGARPGGGGSLSRANRPPGANGVDDFSLSPTGRRSNAMYDVRHVELSLVLDSRLMPAFFEQLRQVNFMTVLSMDLTNVDEYQAMQEGYIYGSGDAVRADMLIETIWLRDWTVAYMHESVRNMLGVSEQ